MKNTKFYRCAHCGNLVGMVHDAGVTPVCCGQKMTLLDPATSDGAVEKHLPVVTVNGNTVYVEVGSAAHPMTEEHSIEWIYLQTDKGGQRKNLSPNEAPAVTFALTDETPVAVYAYCNLHGLWKTEV